jgi:hypothetical protein
MTRTSYGTPKEYTSWTIANWRAASAYPVVAHRGAPNGHTRAEFSWDAFDTAIAAGFRCLELSSQVSSDGVWVLSHDATTGEQYTTNVTISATSWAVLQTLTRKYGVTTEPMRRLDETLARYSNYIFQVENKTFGNYTPYHAILTAVPNYQNKIIWKCQGSTPGAFALARGLGFTTWAYYFGSAGCVDMVNEDNPDEMWVGLSSGPTNLATAQTYFDWAIARSKPILAHIIRGAADWTSMKAQGATMATSNDITQIPLS